MADNYLGNKMDDYLSGRLRASAPSPHVKKNGLNVSVSPVRSVWMPVGAWTPAGEAVVAAMCGAGMEVAYSHERSRQGARLAERYGARHVPDDVDAPDFGHKVEVWSDTITIDSGRVEIAYDGDDPDQVQRAATIAAFFVTPVGRYSTAEITLKNNPDL